ARGFLALLQNGSLDRHYAAVWQPSPLFTSTEVHGLDPPEHLTRCRQLLTDGYRPSSISVTEIRASKPLVTASVWHRPVVPEDDKEKLAKRQANAAVALLKVDQPHKVWPLLQHSPDPRVRSYLVHSVTSLEADPNALFKQLKVEKEVSIRRALLLCLGEF